VSQRNEPPEIPPEFTPELLNRLYKISELTQYPESKVLLEAEVARLGLAHLQRELDTLFAIAGGAGTTYLASLAEPPKSSPELWTKVDEVIRAASPWLNDENFGRAKYQARYIAWHDGLVSG
jgi:hypothetical protein